MPRVRTSSLLALTLALAITLAGCGSSDDPGADPGPTPTPTSPTSSPTTEPSTPAPSASASPTATSTATSSGTPGADKTGGLGARPRARVDVAHLLDADRMPTLGDAGWTVRSTSNDDPVSGRPVGACQKAALGPIGAVSSVRRTFAGPDGVAATQVVGEFADSRSAWRAHQVLVAWRDDCVERLDLPHAQVGPLRPVRVHAGTGESYRATYGRKARAHRKYAGLGILRTGSYLTVVEITAGPNGYPDGWDPTRAVVRRISRTF